MRSRISTARSPATLDGVDHRVVLARIVAGALLKPDAEPMLHVRKSGFHY